MQAFSDLPLHFLALFAMSNDMWGSCPFPSYLIFFVSNPNFGKELEKRRKIRQLCFTLALQCAILNPFVDLVDQDQDAENVILNLQCPIRRYFSS